ncbi:MAG TPA: GNAT family N-acetyltransferase [Candidatus Nanopelagicales bacterium]|nr:GNAT family N-acetyltransferase [Candidatus Nanopelagicales bacterium]
MSLDVALLDTWDDDDVAQLAAVMVDCVDGGASVNFLRPLRFGDAVRWWQDALADPHTRTWVAREDGSTIVGCVRLGLAQQPNGRHRGEVGKMLVMRTARGRGAARALLEALETWAAANGRHRLVLDTETGSDAERVYQRLGWTRVGDVPDFALTADGDLTSTTYYTKGLARP